MTERILGEYGPMAGLAGTLEGGASALRTVQSSTLATCGNPGLDGAVTSFAGSFRAMAQQIADGAQKAAGNVRTTAANFTAADR